MYIHTRIYDVISPLFTENNYIQYVLLVFQRMFVNSAKTSLLYIVEQSIIEWVWFRFQIGWSQIIL